MCSQGWERLLWSLTGSTPGTVEPFVLQMVSYNMLSGFPHINPRVLTLNSKIHLNSCFYRILSLISVGECACIIQTEDLFSNAFLTFNTKVICVPLNKFPPSSQALAPANFCSEAGTPRNSDSEEFVFLQPADILTPSLTKSATEISLEISNNL